MPSTTEDADALRAAIARGVRRAKINGEELEYHSLADMKAALRQIENELGSTPGGTIGVSYPVVGRGL
ncbi:MAG: phage head-tail joining protein [Marinibacterium sp.]